MSSNGVDVLAVMDRAAKAIEDQWAIYEGAGDLVNARAAVAELMEAAATAEAALADIGDADREPGDDVAWCERRAAVAIPRLRAALAAMGESQ